MTEPLFSPEVVASVTSVTNICRCSHAPLCIEHSHTRTTNTGSWDCVLHDHATFLAVAEALGAPAVIEDQPPPVPNERKAIADLVIEDIEERKRIGTERYGTPLQAFNGREALVDLYQELLDAVQYIRQLIEEERAR